MKTENNATESYSTNVLRIKDYWMDIIQAAFPNALVNFIENYDDYNSAFEIVPCPNVTLLLLVNFCDMYNIDLQLYRTILSTKTVFSHKIFTGTIPSDNNYEPDEEFIIKLMKCWKNFYNLNLWKQY